MPKRLIPLSGLDAGFLYLEAAGTPMHVGSLMLIEPPKRRNYDFHDALLAHVAQRLPRAPALRRVLHEAPLDIGHPLWSEAETLDLRRHLRRRRLPGRGTRQCLMRLVGRLHAESLPRDEPLWRFVVIDNVEGGLVALYSKVHHALLDGQGGIALAQALLDIEPSPARRKTSKPPSKTANERVRRRDLASTAGRASLGQFAKLLRAVPATFKLAGSLGQAARLAGSLRENLLLAPRTPWNRQIGPGRGFAAMSLPLEDCKRMARTAGVSLNDIVLAVCAGAVRELLSNSGQLPRKPLVAAMPVSLRESGNQDVNNQVSMVQCSLATDVADPLQRLRAIHASTAQIKQRVASVKDLIPTDFPGLAAPLWATGLSRLWRRGRIAERLPPLANIAISNVPGPPMDLYLAGARLRHYYPVSIVTHGLALNITVQSYAGSLEFGLTTCSDAIERPERLANAIAASARQLSEALSA
ncbi:wax ester/triacylglycerol synthase family O-acyltransferase [Arenimonas sp.]|uniref:wax ester/triacylglycerol synthase family O-acyltransferase n=1 Tax=Arenimonas sp. TaxID=1872635 RepID=UPI0039E53EEB